MPYNSNTNRNSTMSCPRCNGVTTVNINGQTMSCPLCHGTGTVTPPVHSRYLASQANSAATAIPVHTTSSLLNNTPVVDNSVPAAAKSSKFIQDALFNLQSSSSASSAIPTDPRGREKYAIQREERRRNLPAASSSEELVTCPRCRGNREVKDNFKMITCQLCGGEGIVGDGSRLIYLQTPRHDN